MDPPTATVPGDAAVPTDDITTTNTAATANKTTNTTANETANETSSHSHAAALLNKAMHHKAEPTGAENIDQSDQAPKHPPKIKNVTSTLLKPLKDNDLFGGLLHETSSSSMSSDSDFEENEDKNLIPLSRANPKLKLETMSANVLDNIINLWFIVYLIAIGLLIFYPIAANTFLKKELTFNTSPTTTETVGVVWRDGTDFALGDIIFRSILCFILLVTLTIFVYHLLKTKRKNRVLCQYLVIMLAASSILALFPWQVLDYSPSLKSEPEVNEAMLEQRIDSVSTKLMTVFRGLFLLVANWYIWIKARAVCLNIPMGWKMYVWPTCICLLDLLVYYLGFFGAKLVWNPGIPFALSNVILAGVIGVGTPYISVFQFLILFSNSIISIYILAVVLMWLGRADAALKGLSYSIFHSEHVSFQFFRANFFQYLIFHIVTSFVQSFSSPLAFQSIIPKVTGIGAVISWQLDASSVVLIYFVFLELITVFPVRAADPLQCWKTVDIANWQDNQIKIWRNEKYDEKGELVIHPRIFILDSIVLMINFCFLAYEFNNKSEVVPVLENFKDPRFKLVAHIKNEELDSHAGVFEGEDRIIVAFRGTKSTINVKSDLQATSIPLSRVLENEFTPDAHESFMHLVEEAPELVQKARWLTEETVAMVHDSEKGARVHSGFGLAYKSVGAEIICLVAALLEKKERPVYIAGHSLGGAMATICAFHFTRVFPQLMPNRLFVVTCGSPRVGNAMFRRIFEKSVFNYWRMAFAGDPIPKVPSAPFSHVGNRVIVRVDGEIILDPTKVEVWNNKRVRIVLPYHKMWSYRRAVEVWCQLYIPNYVPFFWKPVDGFPPEVAALFANNDEKLQHVKMLQLRQYFSVDFDDFALDEKNIEAVQKAPKAVVDKWMDLIGRLVEKHQRQYPKAASARSEIEILASK